VDFVRTPAPSTEDFGNFYGGQWWLVPDARTDLPQDAYTAAWRVRSLPGETGGRAR
jgi:hypothetical protein